MILSVQAFLSLRFIEYFLKKVNCSVVDTRVLTFPQASNIQYFNLVGLRPFLYGFWITPLGQINY